MKVDREKFPHLDKAEIEEFLKSLKDIERATLLEIIENITDDGIIDTFNQRIADLESSLEEYDDFHQEIRTMIQSDSWDPESVLRKLDELSL